MKSGHILNQRTQPSSLSRRSLATCQACVALRTLAVYTRPVAEKEATRGESRNVPRRTTAIKRFFYVRKPLRASFYGRALVGVRLRTPVPLDAGLSTLSCARPPHLRVGMRVLEPVQGDRTVRLFSARPELSTVSNELLLTVPAALRCDVVIPIATHDVAPVISSSVAPFFFGVVRNG
jgi:hypothetical protein